MSQTSDTELRQLWDSTEQFVITSSYNTGKHLHLPGKGGPLCNNVHTNNGEWQTKPASVYPVGFKNVCSECVEVWRER